MKIAPVNNTSFYKSNNASPENKRLKFETLIKSDSAISSRSAYEIINRASQKDYEAKINMYKFIKEHIRPENPEYLYSMKAVSYANNDNLPFALSLISDKNYPKRGMDELLSVVNKDNMEIGKIMIKEKP